IPLAPSWPYFSTLVPTCTRALTPPTLAEGGRNGRLASTALGPLIFFFFFFFFFFPQRSWMSADIKEDLKVTPRLPYLRRGKQQGNKLRSFCHDICRLSNLHLC
uniref:Uncharacterized protein n=1 Tax=Gasterosteus aculeatus TaxID=69293 RepID=G3P0P4_GASAC